MEKFNPIDLTACTGSGDVILEHKSAVMLELQVTKDRPELTTVSVIFPYSGNLSKRKKGAMAEILSEVLMHLGCVSDAETAATSATALINSWRAYKAANLRISRGPFETVSVRMDGAGSVGNAPHDVLICGNDF